MQRRLQLHEQGGPSQQSMALIAPDSTGMPVYEPVHDPPQRAPDTNYGALPCVARIPA
jgi:hypothetical protein